MSKNREKVITQNMSKNKATAMCGVFIALAFFLILKI